MTRSLELSVRSASPVEACPGRQTLISSGTDGIRSTVCEEENGEATVPTEQDLGNNFSPTSMQYLPKKRGRHSKRQHSEVLTSAPMKLQLDEKRKKDEKERSKDRN
ncbi:hypothetical protein J6590_081702 [Homalodisca vitripennis]|nr:hypothetical protein J6590_081702 [Homalodisca vitripennis]